MTADSRWIIPSGTAGRDGFDLVVDDTIDGWAHTGLRVVTLRAGEQVPIPAGPWEHLVVPLSGPVKVVAIDDNGGGATNVDLTGRPSVFDGATDTAYTPAGWSVTLIGTDPVARVAVCSAAVQQRTVRRPSYLPSGGVPIELRGAGFASREVRNFGGVDVLDADRLIACEVVTPAGNWSSYPPHKHDEERPGVETELEEIYYFEMRVDRDAHKAQLDAHKAQLDGDEAGADPLAYHRVSGTADRPIDVLAEVRNGDVVLVPHGWHGPSMAPPGYDLYYLNVMAGPGPTRAWLICDHPRHGWVRETWLGQKIDPRLPMGGAP